MEEISNTINNLDLAGRRKVSGLLGAIGVIALRWLLGGLFIYAGVTKAMNPDGFISDLERFQLLPEFLIAPSAIYLPFLEILTGITLITGIFYLGALLLTKGMLLIFSLGLSLAWWKGLDITCGCFGRGLGELTVQWALLRNVVLFALCLALTLAFFQRKQPAVARIAANTPT